MTVTPSVQTQTVSIDVRGRPRPQGSMKMHRLPNGGTAVRYPAEVYKWRAQVQQAVVDARWDQFEGAVEVRLGFEVAHLATHYWPFNSKHDGELRDDVPTYPTTAPDVDKLCRAVLDSCTDAGLWRDDAQVAVLTAAKRYGEQPGVLIQVRAL